MATAANTPPTRDYVRRLAPIRRLPKATEFTDDAQLQDPIFIIRQLKRLPQIWDALHEGTTRTPDRRGGRPRLEGSWALVYVAMTVLGKVDLETFWSESQSAAFWAECGFNSVPAWGTFYERITELEKGDWGCEDVILDPAATAARIGGWRSSDSTAPDASELDEAAPPREVIVGAWPLFEEAAAKLIRIARSKDANVAAHGMADGTAYHSQARLEHCCPDPDECRRRRLKRDGSLRRVPKIVERAADELVRERHHREDAGPEPTPGELPQDALRELTPQDEWGPQLLADTEHKYVWVNDHLYRTRDTTAGLRLYDNGGRGRRRAWIGGASMVMVDPYTGGLTAFNCLPADVNEPDGWDVLMRRHKRNTGSFPGCVSADKGPAVSSVIEYNTRRGIHSAMPFRKDGLGRVARDLECERFDRHGVPRCQICGGRGRVDGPGLGFVKDDGRGNPIIRYTCAGLWAGTGCADAGIQHIDCSTAWKALLPLTREHRQHHILRHAHSNGAEGPFHHWRQRYGIAGKAYATRPKRRLSRHCQELRTACAMLIDWLRICLRHGWIGNHARRNTETAVDRTDGGRLAVVINARHAYRLDLPYGPAALAAGLCKTDDLPPKFVDRPRRARPEPPPGAIPWDDPNAPPAAQGPDEIPF